MIQAHHITKSYSTALGRVSRKVLDQLALDVSSGERIAIMGPSGSGKTTLLNLLSSIDTPDEGTIVVDGVTLGGMSQQEILRYRNHQVGFVFQFHRLLPQCTLWENVLLPTLADGKPSAETLDRGQALLERLGIAGVQHQFPGELSGGECQRAAVARALINAPKVLLADEPTGSLDRANAFNLMELLITLQAETGITMVTATHSHEIAQMMQKTYTLTDGKLTL